MSRKRWCFIQICDIIILFLIEIREWEGEFMEAALLIGNGLNRCYKGAVPWDKLLERIANEYNVQFNDNNPFPLEFESIAN